MTDKTRLSVDGVPSDDVSHDLATAKQLVKFRDTKRFFR
jgi:hypothetical protein